ncbi:hypothetical protein R1flu_011619 [Riccia fluitans]|uniref:Uncharacterized protein n=1 Tax=Riccia fluitans TaxID=41844 RepID=A0ABD1ZBL1_9MARC
MRSRLTNRETSRWEWAPREDATSNRVIPAVLKLAPVTMENRVLKLKVRSFANRRGFPYSLRRIENSFTVSELSVPSRRSQSPSTEAYACILSSQNVPIGDVCKSIG